MPIEVTWGNLEKTYTIFTFNGTWSWDEYYNAIKTGSELIADVPYIVNIVIDMTGSELLPNNLLSHSNSSMRQPPRHFDLAVIVTNSAFIKMFGQILDRLFKNKTRFRVVNTLEDAHQMLREYDAMAAQGNRRPPTLSRRPK